MERTRTFHAFFPFLIFFFKFLKMYFWDYTGTFQTGRIYSGIPILRTSKGNENWFEKSASLKEIQGKNDVLG